MTLALAHLETRRASLLGQLDQDWSVIRCSVGERNSTRFMRLAHQAPVDAHRREAVGPVRRGSRPNIGEAGQVRRTQCVVVSNQGLQIWTSLEDVPKLASIGKLTMVQVNGRDPVVLKMDDQRDASLNQPKHRDRQIKPRRQG